MGFTTPSHIPELPFPPPDSVPVHEFLFGEQSNYGRHPIDSSNPPFTCGLTAKAYSAPDVAKRIDYLARALASQLGWQVNEGDELDKVICTFSVNTIDTLTATWATHRLNGVSNHINTAYSTSELTHQLKAVKCKALLTCLPLLDTALTSAAAAGIPIKHVYILHTPLKRPHHLPTATGLQTVDQLIEKGSKLPPLDLLRWTPGQGARQTAFLCSSSGTSGLPKNTRLSHKNVIANVLQAAVHESTYKSSKPEMCLGVLPISHNFGLIGVCHLSIYRGDGVVILPNFDLQEMLRVAQEFKLNRLWMVPAMIGAIVRAPAILKCYDISDVNTVVVGASSLTKDIARAVDNIIPGCKLVQGYGLTETTVAVTFGHPHDIMFGSCGCLFPGCDARLIDRDGNEIKEYGVAGELWIRSPSVMLGYLNNDIETANMLTQDGWLRTGDLVEFRRSDKGFDHLFVIDRIKELIKVRGLQVSPVELEQHLLRHSAVLDAAVVPIPDEDAGEVPLAFIVRSPSSLGLDEKDIASQIQLHMNEAFATHKRLAGGIEFVDALPKTAAGKTKRGALKDLAKSIVQTRKEAEEDGEFEVYDFDSDGELVDDEYEDEYMTSGGKLNSVEPVLIQA